MNASVVLILITEASVRSQLSLLLREVSCSPHFCNDVEEALKMCVNGQYTHVIVDNDYPGFRPGEVASRVKASVPGLLVMAVADSPGAGATPPPFNLGLAAILFKPFDARNALEQLEAFCRKKPGTGTPFLPLPSVEKRSAATVFRKVRATQVPFPSSRTAPSPEAAPEAAPKADLLPELASTEPPVPHPRYITARCSASRLLFSRIWKTRHFTNCLVIAGENGTEFELIIRESLSVAGDSLGSPIFLNPNEITSDFLSCLNARAQLSSAPPPIAFLADAESLTASRAKVLREFIRSNSNTSSKHIRLALAFVTDRPPDEGDTSSAVESVLMAAEERIDVPALRDRRADIPYLVQKVLTDMVTLHPILPVRDIEPQAMEYLQGYLWRGNFAQLVSVLRSAAVNCRGRMLGMQHLEPLLLSDLSAFHLLESAADQELLEAT